MKPKAANVLEEYDLEVLSTWKIRGALCCETDKGLFVLKEFGGHGEKLLVQHEFLDFLKQHDFFQAEELIKNKEGNFFSQDAEGNSYILKTYIDGRECSVSKDPDSLADGRTAMRTLAKLHRLSEEFKRTTQVSGTMRKSLIVQEYEKHNRELKKVRRFLKEKGQKSDFEHFLQQHFDIFMEQALIILQQLKEEIPEPEHILLCHGDFQYHNVLFRKEEAWLLNFEKCIWDNRTRDIYHFSRKMLEKCDWMPEVGKELLDAYEKEFPLSEEDGKQLYYRFCYPEKFWKIVNFYYNRGKAFIPEKNQEKLENLLQQEGKKQDFIQNVVKSRFAI